MSRKERLSKTILECVQRNEISQAEAARRLNISYRQAKRRYKRFLAEGDAGLVHRSRGKSSARQYPNTFRLKTLELYETHYPDFGPTLAAEKMQEDHKHPVNPETLRLWLKQAGIWAGRRKRKQHRQRRARRVRFGELLQLDGSIHPWFEGNSEKQCLMNLVDDATGITESFLDTGETTYAAFKVLEQWIRKYGIPVAVYVDLKSLYVSPNALKEDEEPVEAEWLTHFSLACQRLGIEVIKAYSPQAKGRVERKHAVYQDRFVKELKLKGITTIAEANKLLQQGFTDKLNQKFAKSPSDNQDAHIPLLPENNLSQILCWDITRTVKNDWTVQLNNQHYQLEKTQPASIVPRQKITVRRHMDNAITLWSKDTALAFHAIEARPEQPATKPKTKPAYTAEQRRLNSIKNKRKSPWSQYNKHWLHKDKTIPYSRVNEPA